MAPDAPRPPRTVSEVEADEERLTAIANALADAVEATVPGWIERLVVERVRAETGHVGAEVTAEAAEAGLAARDELMPKLRTLLQADIDEQAANPLELLRAITPHAGAVLERLGVPPTPRDQFSVRSFPHDTYGLVPATWADVDDDLHELGIAWGAAKAFVHRARRRDEGQV